jgi:hypothetical protein
LALAACVQKLLWTVSMSRALLIIFTLAIGFLVGWFLHTYYSYRNAKLSTPREVSDRNS